MNYLLLAILSSALISVIMRLSTDKVSGNVSMLAMNYLTCLCLAAFYTGASDLFPREAALPQALGMGAVHGLLYLMSFVLFQRSVRRNGVVLSAIFMKLGLLVPLVVSIFLFGETPTALQLLGFAIAVCAIILINLQKGASGSVSGISLVVLLLAGGTADAMSKVFEQLGPAALSAQFLLYTFLTAFLLCLGLMLMKKQRLGKAEIFYGFVIGIPNFFSAKFLLRALEELDAVIVYPTYSVATILVVTLAGIAVFREKLNARQWLAVGAILAALVLLNV